MSYQPLPPLGQAVAASSLPVILPSATITTLTPPAAITGFALDATLTGGTQQSKITDGTNIGNVLKSDGTAAGQNAQLVAPAVQTLTFTTSTPGAQTILANTDVSHYAWIEVVYTSVGSGLALTGQFSTASGGTYVNSSSFVTGAGSPASPLGVANSTIYNGPIKGNFFQIAVSALTSGSFTGTVTLRAAAPPPISVAVVQTGTWNIGSSTATGSAVPANAFYIGVSDGANLGGLRSGAQGGTWAAQFDSSTSHSGSNSMKLSTKATGSSIVIGTVIAATAKGILNAIPVSKTGVPYNLSFWMSTNYVSGDSNDGAFVVFKTRNAAGGTVTSANSTKVKTTTGWTKYTATITPGASSVVFDVQLSITGSSGTATLIMDAWFDDIFLLPVYRTLI